MTDRGIELPGHFQTISELSVDKIILGINFRGPIERLNRLRDAIEINVTVTDRLEHAGAARTERRGAHNCIQRFLRMPARFFSAGQLNPGVNPIRLNRSRALRERETLIVMTKTTRANAGEQPANGPVRLEPIRLLQ